jgi:hypothetical protein
MSTSDRSKTWAQDTWKRIEGSKARDYIIAVANGETQVESKADQIRLDTCWQALRLACPAVPQTSINVETDRIPDFAIVHAKD